MGGAGAPHAGNLSPRKKHGSARVPWFFGTRALRGRYFFLVAAPVTGPLPKRFSNRATRPPVSRIFCLPV
jgi:hypothetical protein